MAIRRKPRSTPVPPAEAFIHGAPDGLPEPKQAKHPYEKGIPKGHKRQISLTISPDLLQRVDECAQKAGIGRAAFISLALYKAVQEY